MLQLAAGPRPKLWCSSSSSINTVLRCAAASPGSCHPIAASGRLARPSMRCAIDPVASTVKGAHAASPRRRTGRRDTSARAAANSDSGGGGGGVDGGVVGGKATAQQQQQQQAELSRLSVPSAAPPKAHDHHNHNHNGAEAAGATSNGHHHHASALATTTATTTTPPAAPPSDRQQQRQQQWKGAKLPNAAAAIALGLAIRFGLPVPDGLDPQAWSLLALFVTTVAGLVLEPVAAGAWALMCCGAAVATRTLTFDEAFAAADSEVLWLIINAFFLAKAIEKTGLGERIAELLVRTFGGSTRSLGLSLAIGEAVLAPGMPSTTARAAGIFVPVIKSVAAAGGSLPTDDVSRNRLGAYLVLSQLQAVCHSSTLFLTAAAQNLLCLQLAEAAGVDLGNHFLVWAQGAVAPALVGTVVAPNLVYLLQPPTVTETPEAPRMAAERLERLGPLSRDEAATVAAVGVALALWVAGDRAGVPPPVAAMLAVALLLGAGVLDWRKDCIGGCPQAFDTMFWFGVLVSMSQALQSHGVVEAFTAWATDGLAALNGAGASDAAAAAAAADPSLLLQWPALFGALHLAFFLLHYLFASQMAHVGALYTAFLSLMLAGGVPPKLAAMSLAYSVCLQGGLTHYASSQAAAYYGTGYVKLKELYWTGAGCGAAALLIWSTVGMGWWKALGWW